MELRDRFNGMSFVLAGDPGKFDDCIVPFIEALRGQIDPELNSNTTFLLVPLNGDSSASRKAAAEFNKNGSAIKVINVNDLFIMCDDFAPAEYLQAVCSEHSGAIGKFHKVIGKIESLHLSFAKLRRYRLRFAEWPPVVMKSSDLSHARIDGLPSASLEKVRLNNAILTGAYDMMTATNCQFNDITCSDATMNGASLTASQLRRARFNNTSLVNVVLDGCNLDRVVFENCDLSNASLKEACLIEADFTNAIIDGADFTGANVSFARFNSSEVHKAIGLAEAMECQRREGDCLRGLDAAAINSELFIVIITAAYQKSHVQLALVYKDSCAKADARELPIRIPPSLFIEVEAPSPAMCLMKLAAHFKEAIIDPSSILVRIEGGTVKSGQLKQIAVKAWYEALGLEVPDHEVIKAIKAAPKTVKSKQLDVLMAELRGGKSGIQKWNARSSKEQASGGRLQKIDLSNQDLSGARFRFMHFENGIFDAADLSHAVFEGCYVTGASFKNCCLEQATFHDTKAKQADFSNTNMRNTKITESRRAMATLLQARFDNADLSGAVLMVSLQGADLSKAHLQTALMKESYFDKDTKFPPGFDTTELTWGGEGPDPRRLNEVMESIPHGLSIEDFLKRLEESVDPKRLEKALQMLKTERIDLFVEVKDNEVVGVLKSQPPADNLVNSVRLASNGTFACCSQNLSPCRGLRGSLCKHLLALVIGLTKAGQLDATTIDTWVRASRIQKPTLDRELMAGIFVRFKGAEAGEFDWRHTETVPEDYYAF